MTETRRIYSASTELMQFTLECERLGYTNNSSLRAMKFEWCRDTGAWFATYENNCIVSVSGIHTFKDGYRALFRGAQLHPRPVGINKHHMQSYCFHSQLPHQIKYAGPKPIYITTNTETDASGKMTRIDRTFQLLEKTGLVEYVGAEEVFYVQQNIWRLNVDRYNAVRKNYQ